MEVHTLFYKYFYRSVGALTSNNIFIIVIKNMMKNVFYVDNVLKHVQEYKAYLVSMSFQYKTTLSAYTVDNVLYGVQLVLLKNVT